MAGTVWMGGQRTGGWGNAPRNVGWGGSASSNLNLGSGDISSLINNLGNVPATTQNSNSYGTQTIGNTRVSNTQNQSTQRQTGTVQTQQQNMTNQALAALNAIVSGQSTDPLLGAKDQASAANIQFMQSLLAGLNPQEAEQRASGRTADLRRKLTEDVLPGLFGRSEAAGFGTNALSQLLAQDAAVRTAEAQNRAVEEAYFNTVNAGIQGASTLGQLTQGTSASTQAMLEALGISKGAVSNTVENRNLTTTGQETGTATTSETGQATTSEQGQQSKVDPLGWANMLAGLLNTQMQLDQGPSANEKAMAAFMAAGGDPSALGRTSFHDYGYGRSQNQLWQSIASRFGAS